MSIIRFIRLKLRQFYDSFFCIDTKDKFCLGLDASWHVDISQINSNSIVYSGGVGNDISFEIDLVQRTGCTILLFDPSHTGIQTIEKEAKRLKNIHFSPIGLSKLDGLVQFSSPQSIDEGSYTVLLQDSKDIIEFACRSISSIALENKHNVIDLIKLDIEGFEYDVIDDILNSPIEVKQICVEFHHFFKEIKRSRTMRTIRKLKKHGYRIIHKTRCDYTLIKIG